MFFDDELDGCPNDTVADWVNKNEAAIRLIAENRDYKSGNSKERILEMVLKLIFDAYDLKKCPYA